MDLFILPLLFLVLYIVVMLIIGKKQLEKRKNGYKPKNFADKMPHEYTPSQKRFSLFIGLFLISSSIVLLVLLIYYKQSKLVSILVPLLPITWLLLIKQGNKIK